MKDSVGRNAGDAPRVDALDTLSAVAPTVLTCYRCHSWPCACEDGQTIIHGDCRDFAAFIEADAIITDPVWPNAVAELPGSDDPHGLLSSTLPHFVGRVPRLAIQIGCDSDPRFLSAVPPAWAFFRTCNLEYVRPHYKGRLLYTHDVAYLFGEPPPSRPGAHVIPGRCIQNDSAKRPSGHPCPRQLMHVRWLVRWFGGDTVLDPYCGSGTTLLACKQGGVRGIGIEINEKWCALAARRLQQKVLAFPEDTP